MPSAEAPTSALFARDGRANRAMYIHLGRSPSLRMFFAYLVSSFDQNILGLA
jgi:hypothetical protein